MVHSRCLALLVAVLGLANLCSVQAVDADELSFPMIGAANATKQWKMVWYQKNEGEADFYLHNCTSPAQWGCPQYPPLKQDRDDQIRVDYTLANPRGPGGALATYKGQQPTEIQFRMCYSLAVATDRAWRKKNKPYPRFSQNCPNTFATVPFVGSTSPLDPAANSGSAYLRMNEQDEIPTAAWFIMMWVYCGDKVCAFESTEGNATAVPPVPGNYYQTEVVMGITPGMRAAAIVLSIFGPAFFICFWIADSLHYKKTGKAIRLA